MQQKDTGRNDCDGNRYRKGPECDTLILENRRSPTPNLLYRTKQRNYGQQIAAVDPKRKIPTDAEDGEENSESKDRYTEGHINSPDVRILSSGEHHANHCDGRN